MALIQIALIWVVYAVVVALLGVTAAILIFLYQNTKERAASVTAVSIFTITALLATVLLLPVDVALVSSTTKSSTGTRKEWATQQEVDKITYTLTIVWYTLFSLDALLCLVVVPFTYFWHEEYDDVDAEEGQQSFGQRFWGAFKYTIGFILFCVILFLVGFFVPVAKGTGDIGRDLDYFKHLLEENHGERALTFALGLLTTIGTLLYVVYTGSGLALLPLTLIKSAPSISAPGFAEDTRSQLENNRERQHQLELRNEGREGGLSAKDQRELEALVREERTLVRRERLAAEASGESATWLIKTWLKIEAIFRPLKLLGGLLLILVNIFLWVCILLTGIDKAAHSVCKERCGYVLTKIEIFNPMNWILVESSKIFPIDYVIFLVVTLIFFFSSVVGTGLIGIRFLWVRIFEIRKSHTSPQAILLATVLLTLMTLAIQYSLAMMLAPQYSHYGPQTFCDHPVQPGKQPDCSDHPNHIRACSEKARNQGAATNVCTPSVISTFLDRMTLNFSFFGIIDFWAQFAFLGVFAIVFLVSLFRTPKLGVEDIDRDAEEAEEEGLLASTGRRFGATWEDITGRRSKTTTGAGSSSAN